MDKLEDFKEFLDSTSYGRKYELAIDKWLREQTKEVREEFLKISKEFSARGQPVSWSALAEWLSRQYPGFPVRAAGVKRWFEETFGKAG